MTTETKAEKFSRLYQKRLFKVVKDMELLSNLGRSTYESDAKQRDLIRVEVLGAVRQVEKAFGITIADSPKTIISHEASQNVQPGSPVEGHDRAAIRAALSQLQSGDTDKGAKALRKVVLGWPAEAWGSNGNAA